MLLLLLLLPECAAAQGLGTTTSQSFVSAAVQVTMFLITVLNFLAWFFLSLLDHIMNPRFIFNLNEDGTDGALLFMLREIWQFSRDLVNLGFAIGLIVGAVMMIVTADGTKLKEHMPKFVLALVLVNFSWFVPRVLYDASQIVTYTIYQIPSMMGNAGCVVPATGTDVGPQPCKVVLKFKFFTEQTRTINQTTGIDTADNSTGWKCPLPPLVCIQTASINDASTQVRSETRVLDGLIVNHARLQTLAQIQNAEANVELGEGTPTMAALQRLLGIIVKLVVILVLHIAIVFPLIAMTAAFFIRIPVIWVSMAFMPLVALGYAFPKLREGEYKDLFWEWQNHFFQAIFLPARVAVPFVIGFIMLNAASQVAPPENFGDFPLLPIFVGIRDLWQIMWMGIALFIIWDQSFKALKSDKAGFMGHFTDKIQAVGSSLGSIATSIPMSIPILPLGAGGQKLSIGNILNTADPRAFASHLKNQPNLSLESNKEFFAQRAGLRPRAPADLTQFMQKAQQNNDVRITRNITNIVTASSSNDPKVLREQMEKSIADMRHEFRREMSGRTNQDIIRSLIQADTRQFAGRTEAIDKILSSDTAFANNRGTPTS